MQDRKVVIMTVYGVGNAAGAPVAVATQNLKNQQQSVAAMPLNKASAAGSEENSQSLKRTKAFLTLAVLGTITYGLIRYKNAQALKPFIENLEKTTNKPVPDGQVSVMLSFGHKRLFGSEVSI